MKPSQLVSQFCVGAFLFIGLEGSPRGDDVTAGKRSKRESTLAWNKCSNNFGGESVTQGRLWLSACDYARLSGVNSRRRVFHRPRRDSRSVVIRDSSTGYCE